MHGYGHPLRAKSKQKSRTKNFATPKRDKQANGAYKNRHKDRIIRETFNQEEKHQNLIQKLLKHRGRRKSAITIKKLPINQRVRRRLVRQNEKG